MQSIDIKEVEEIIEKKIRKNAVCVGFDVAQNTTGCCILCTDKEKIYIKSLQVIKTEGKSDIIHKMEQFLNSIDKFKQEIKDSGFKIIVLEDSWLGNNPYCLKQLTRFSTLLWMIFRKESDYIFFVLPNSARAQIKFNKNKQLKESDIEAINFTKGKNKGKPKPISIKDLIDDYLKMTFGVDIEEENERDAFVLALCGLVQ